MISSDCRTTAVAPAMTYPRYSSQTVGWRNKTTETGGEIFLADSPAAELRPVEEEAVHGGPGERDGPRGFAPQDPRGHLSRESALLFHGGNTATDDPCSHHGVIEGEDGDAGRRRNPLQHVPAAPWRFLRRGPACSC